MNRLLRLALSLTLLSTTLLSCQKPDPDEPPTPDPYVGVSFETQQANMNNGGYAVGDEEALYFYNFVSNEKIQLCRKDRSSGAITVLDEIEKEASLDGDILYSNLCLVGDYLYYIPYDCDNQEISNLLWRIKTDGTDKSVIINKNVYQYQICFGKICYSTYAAPSGLYVANLDGSNPVQLLNEMPDSFFIAKDGIYYTDYTHEGGFHAQLMKLITGLDGSTPKKVIYDSQRMLYALLSENNKLYCLDFDESSAATLVRIDPTTQESTTLVADLPYTRMNIAGNTLYLMIPEGGGSWLPGLYTYTPGTNSPVLLQGVSSERFFLVGDSQIVYANHADTDESGRFHQLYLCDYQGTDLGKLAQ